MIFDVKNFFTRKARFVAWGHLTDAPSSVTYSSVVSHDSVRIAFLVAALNGLDVMACDIGNAYLSAPCRKKVWFVGGTENGNDKGQVMVVTRALYGLKSSGASWRNMLSGTINSLPYRPIPMYIDVQLRNPIVRSITSSYSSMSTIYLHPFVRPLPPVSYVLVKRTVTLTLPTHSPNHFHANGIMIYSAKLPIPLCFLQMVLPHVHLNRPSCHESLLPTRVAGAVQIQLW